MIPNEQSWIKRAYIELTRLRKSEFAHGMWSLKGVSDTACASLRALHCPMANCRDRTSKCVDLSDLKHHLKDRHRRFFCELCLEFRVLLVGEQQTYSKIKLSQHMECGDLSPEGEVISMHPKCPFCGRYYFNEAEFGSHMKQSHMKCHLCKGGELRHIYYKDYPSLRVHFDKTHFACQDKQCVQEAFVVFRSHAELSNHHQSRHMGGGGRSKEKAVKIRTVGTTEDIVFRDDKGVNVKDQLLSERKVQKRVSGGEAEQWKRKLVLLDIFGLIMKVRHGEVEAYKQENGMRNIESARGEGGEKGGKKGYRKEGDLKGLLGEKRIFKVDELRRRAKGEPWDEIVREDIRNGRMEEGRRRKEQKRKMKQKVKREKEDGLVYKRQDEDYGSEDDEGSLEDSYNDVRDRDEGKNHNDNNNRNRGKKRGKKNQSRKGKGKQNNNKNNNFDSENGDDDQENDLGSAGLRIEDIIFKRERNGFKIEYEDLEERARRVLEYKALDEMEDVLYNFESKKVSASGLFKRFETIFGKAHVFKFYYWYLLSLDSDSQRQLLSKNLFRELSRLRFRRHNILVKATHCQDVFVRLENGFVDNLVRRARAGRLMLRVGLHQDRLYQFFKSVKMLNLDEALGLKFLNLYLSGYRALLIIQKAFLVESRGLSAWVDKLSDLDALLAFVYFHLINLKFGGKEMHMKHDTNPNLVKIFFKLHPERADEFGIDPESEDEDYTFIGQQIGSQRRRQAKESQGRAEVGFGDRLREYNERKESQEGDVGKETVADKVGLLVEWWRRFCI